MCAATHARLHGVTICRPAHPHMLWQPRALLVLARKLSCVSKGGTLHDSQQTPDSCHSGGACMTLHLQALEVQRSQLLARSGGRLGVRSQHEPHWCAAPDMTAAQTGL